MLRLLLIAVAVVVVAVIAVLGYAATKPDSFRIARTQRIAAPPEKIYPLISDLHNYALWSPWEHKDPDMRRNFSGAESGVGAVYAWDGNDDVGQGRMEIVEAVPPSALTMELHFIAPFEARNTVTFTLTPDGDATTITWAMHGPQPYVAKVMTMFFDMDAMVGKDFETGLANMKAVAER